MSALMPPLKIKSLQDNCLMSLMFINDRGEKMVAFIGSVKRFCVNKQLMTQWCIGQRLTALGAVVSLVAQGHACHCGKGILRLIAHILHKPIC